MRIEEMTAEAWASAVKEDPVVIVPWGAVEAHGRHLQLGSDTYQPQFVADGVAARMHNVLVAPAVPYGNHSSTKNMPGTICLGFDTVRSLAEDILDSLIAHGARRFAVISGHAGNAHLAALNEACRNVVSRHDVKILCFSDYYIAAKHPECQKLKDDGHAGMLETSRILGIRPDLVSDERPRGEFLSQGYLVVRDASICFPDWMEGDSSASSPGFGKMINDFVIDEVIRMIENDL
jgi:creatinine amidohydrolase